MSDPLDCRKPEPRDDAVVKRRRATSALWAGLWACGISLLLIFSPLVLGKWSINKYIVAFGFIGLAWGVSCLLNGSIDLWRGK